MKSIRENKLTLLVLLCLATLTSATRVVTFKYVDDSATCGDSASDYFDFDLLDFNVDCGNANHGCTPGHSIMIWGECKLRKKEEEEEEEIREMGIVLTPIYTNFSLPILYIIMHYCTFISQRVQLLW